MSAPGESGDDDPRNPATRLIYEAREEAWHARRHIRRGMPEPGDGVLIGAVEALADYRDLLEEYRDHPALETPWDEREPDVDLIPRLLSEFTEEVVARGRTGEPIEVERTLAAADADPTALIALGKELDAIAMELGFCATARDVTPEDEAELGDLRGLLRSRDQESALDQLPGEDGGRR